MKTKSKEQAIRLLKNAGSIAISQDDTKFAINYLNYFGYVSFDLLNNLCEQELQKSVKNFQKLFNLKVDGVIGPKTLRAMNTPRCGCPDQLDKNNENHKQFMTAQVISAEKRNRWNKQGLLYFIADYLPGKVSKQEQSVLFANAFQAWDDVCGLTIKETKNRAKADIILTSGRGTQNNFDGQGGTLAWAYLPRGNNEQLLVKFDLDETWVNKSEARGILISNVACHEFGHILGLTHSKKPNALMAPYYNPFVYSPQQDDDIPRIQKLYGPNTTALKLKNVRKVGNDLAVELMPGQRLVVSCN
jgi:hypothetical protein